MFQAGGPTALRVGTWKHSRHGSPGSKSGGEEGGAGLQLDAHRHGLWLCPKSNRHHGKALSTKETL